MRIAFRAFAIGTAAATLLLPGVGAAAEPLRAKPSRIMSMNQCTDLLLLQMVPKSRIASVSYLAHGAIDSIGAGLDAGVAINYGTAEDVVIQKPDLILAGDFSTAMTRRLAAKARIPLVEFKSARSFADIRVFVRQIGAAVGEPERAEALVAEMDRELAALAATAPPKPYIVAAWTGDRVPGRDTLSNAIIEAAGGVNIGSRLDNDRYNTFGIEELLEARPDVLMYGQNRSGKPSLMTQNNVHAVVRKLYANRQISYPEPLYSCGLPQSARAARELREALASVTGRARP